MSEDSKYRFISNNSGISRLILDKEKDKLHLTHFNLTEHLDKNTYEEINLSKNE